jgi:hypothetical protein
MWIGPALVLGLLTAAVGYPLLVAPPGPATVGNCTAKPDTIREIRKDPILTQHPDLTDLGKADVESLSCGSTSGDGPLQMLAAGVVGARLSGPPPGVDVPAFYTGLAKRSGWRPDTRVSGLFSATKPAPGCPWWFVLTADGDGYRARVYYLPDGAPADSCDWESGNAIVIPLSGK